MNRILVLAILTAIVMCTCDGTTTTVSQMSEEESQRINASMAVTSNTLRYAWLVSRKYTQTVPATITNATVAGSYGKVTFSGTSSESGDRITLVLSSKYDRFGSMFDKLTETMGSDTMILDKNSKQLLEYRTQLRNCEVDFTTATGSFVGTLQFKPPFTVTETDTSTAFSVPYHMSGHLQASSYQWELDESKTFMTTFKK